MNDKVTIEIDWDSKIVGIHQQTISFESRIGAAAYNSYSQMVASLTSKYACDLMQLSAVELRARYQAMFNEQ